MQGAAGGGGAFSARAGGEAGYWIAMGLGIRDFCSVASGGAASSASTGPCDTL